MRNKILLIIVVFLSIYAVMSFNYKTHFSMPKNENIKVKIKDVNDNSVEELELEKYVIGVVAAEMPASFHIEALKAQAIASRSYAVYKMRKSKKNYDLVTDVTNQSYIDIEEMKRKWGKDFEKYYDKIRDAVSTTRGLVLMYDNKVIESYYFSMSNGYTEDSELVFKESKPYLVSVKSDWDNESIKNFSYKTFYSIVDFCDKLSLTCNSLNISDINRSKSNRVLSLKINSKTFSGVEIRKKLKLRSTDFDIKIVDNKVIVTTYGYGHGVGMSQYGANGMAHDGYSYEKILKYYYKDINIEKLKV